MKKVLIMCVLLSVSVFATEKSEMQLEFNKICADINGTMDENGDCDITYATFPQMDTDWEEVADDNSEGCNVDKEDCE